jgi:hypothetical protein
VDRGRGSAVVFEQHRGAASAELPARYRPREPQKTVLHQVVREHLETMLTEAALRSEDGRGYPRFIERELRRFLECGSLGRGFARVRCKACGYERLLAFSCKGRLCPSCQARRMHDQALHLVLRVIPAVPLRQFVLGVPRALRFPLARDAELRRATVGILVRTVFIWQRRLARADGYAHVMPGAVSFLHEAGSALNLNPHPHSIIPDGVFVCEPDEPAFFLELPPPSLLELEALLATIIRRIQRALERSPIQHRDPDAELEDDPLAEAQARAATLRLEPASALDPGPPSQRLCARRDGFSLHAAVTVAARDREGRLRLFRYGARPAFSSRYLSLLPDGRVRYELRRAAPGQKRALILEPTLLLHRLAATLPRPYQHRTVYHGIFAPAASRRLEISPAAPPRRGRHRCGAAARPALTGPASTARTYTLLDSATRRGSDEKAEAEAVARFCAPSPRPPGGRIPWAELIARTFEGALDCPRCSATLSVIAYVTELAAVRKILEHLGLPSGAPEPAPARLPRELDFDFEPAHPSAGSELDDDAPLGTPPRGRGPPSLTD